MSTIIEPDSQAQNEEGLPNWQQVRDGLQFIAESEGCWSGFPMLDDKLRLVVEPRFPHQKLNGARLGGREEPAPPPDDCEIVNSWHSLEKSAMIYILRDKTTGRREAVCLPDNAPGERLRLRLNTLGASRNWSLAAEIAAQERLQELISPYQFKLYVLTGGFLESSKRSKVMYWFRRGLPTVALGPGLGEEAKPLCALCLHPIAHYEDSHAGAMVPSDDVLAHLLMMRCSEQLLWRKANQHPIWESRSGI